MAFSTLEKLLKALISATPPKLINQKRTPHNPTSTWIVRKTDPCDLNSQYSDN